MIDKLAEAQKYSLETALSEMENARKMFAQRRRAKAQEHLITARFWAAKVSPEFTPPDFQQNLSELELKILQG